jgi:Fur family transcriptional regulator, ferric uptake regulator
MDGTRINPTSKLRTPADRFHDFLQSRGMRNTEQRRVLLEYVFAESEYFDADQLLEKLPPKGSANHVSRPTVYRTLAEFVEAGLLRKFELDGRSVYQTDAGLQQHDHLYCVECRKLIEFNSPALTEFACQAAREHQFQVSSHRMIVNGVCYECRQQRRRQKRRVDLI